ncbi:hypothetical protein HMF7854_04425 [Sphingomonas ginkgonis]|uniref:Uncharacterized protein n=1 Tax=Sphingomonas ginkgonis TaxID=2315330 RepID=A0A429V8A6_9SPHN|nr:hypothetical protein [Sphingomonas ginkgonis]RST30154.1 hypothetical protein HMF7854_04425 [Sphingomonas ginkgonis]
MADNTTLNSGAGGDVIATDDIGGIKHQRVKVEFGVDGQASDVANSNPLPTFDRHDGRTLVQFYATGVAAGATGAETAVPLTKAGTLGAAPPAAAASLVPPSGKRFRITSLTFATRGNATATAQVTTFNIRVNAGGVVATTSPGILLQVRLATPATALAWDRLTISFEDDGPELVGDAALQWGITANAVFVTNAPTWDVLITGYEFT